MILAAGSSSLDRAAQYAVNRAFDRLAAVGFKLATMQRINRGSDDPAALLAAEDLTRELRAYEEASASLDYSRAFIHVADTALAHVSSILTDVHTNIVAAADDTLTADQREALQYEVDAALDTIARIGQTSFSGKKIFGEESQFLVGPDPSQTASLNLPTIDGSLGGSSGILDDLRTGGSASVTSGNLETAANIVNDARSVVLSARAQAGAFERYSIDSSQRLLHDTQIQLSSALSFIRDADVAFESANLVREMILSDSAIAIAKLTLRGRRSLLGLFE